MAKLSSQLVQVGGNFRTHDYVPIRQLGGRVSLVDFKGKGTYFAAKFVDLEASTDKDLHHEFEGIRFGKLLKQRNLLPVIAAFVDRTTLWVITPFCELGSAGDLCKPNGFEESVMSVVVQDTLSALEYLHDRGVIHRGVKGSHLLIRQGLCGIHCLLTGLNCAISVVQDGQWRTSMHDYPNKAKDNLNWLAPEILEQNLMGYDNKSDLYSLGVCICELANGVIPYANMEPTEIMLDKMTGNHPKLLDSTCGQFLKLPEGLTDHEREQYEVYQRRRFSDAFHVFTVNLCLNPDPVKRPSASQLLTHGFVKLARKASSSGIISFSSKTLSSSSSNLRRASCSDTPGVKSSSLEDFKDIRWTFE